jgi:hypothetical protein
MSGSQIMYKLKHTRPKIYNPLVFKKNNIRSTKKHSEKTKSVSDLLDMFFLNHCFRVIVHRYALKIYTSMFEK